MMKSPRTLFVIAACSLALALAGRVGPPRAEGQDAGKGNPGTMSTEDWIRKHQEWLEKLEKDKNELLLADKAIREDLKRAREKIAEETKARDKASGELQGALASLALNNPPVCSVVAYAGAWPPPEAEATGSTKVQWEEKVGWALCDGAPYDREKYASLFKGLRRPTLPDYRGLFLRGLDPDGTVDPDRKALGDGGIYSYQADALGSHQHPVTVSGGNHDHGYTWTYPKLETSDDDASNNTDNYFGRGSLRTTENGTTKPSGDLTMTGNSGSNKGHGSDTRPRNRAVNYLIKLR
jgi:hypothetical protein